MFNKITLAVSFCLCLNAPSYASFLPADDVSPLKQDAKTDEQAPMTDAMLIEMLSQDPNIGVLDLSGCEFITDELLRQIPTLCPGLEEADFSCCPKLTKQALSDLSQKCPQLRLMTSDIFSVDKTIPEKTAGGKKKTK